MKGRQILRLIYEHYRICEIDGSLIDFQGLLNVKMHNDNLRRFLNDRETALSGMKDFPTTEIMETLIRLQNHKHSGLWEHMAYYERLPAGHAEINPNTFKVS